MPKPAILLKAFRELGPRASFRLLSYRLRRASGWYRRQVVPPAWTPVVNISALPFRQSVETVRSEAPDLQKRINQLLKGEVEIFGALTTPLDFNVPAELRHWTAHEGTQLDGRDIKYFWEPARFCWAADLVRGYQMTADSRLPDFFTNKLLEFMEENPPYQGPHWANGQEVALRLLNIVLAHSQFEDFIPDIGEILSLHAARIPPTLVYARAQANNHLLSEAAALFTAGLVITGHPDADKWQQLGWQTFCEGILDQFAEDGTYMQQSMNYHRLALQLALWVNAAAAAAGIAFSDRCRTRLAAATRCLLAYCDPTTGAVPNLGPNDGAYIFPLTSQPFSDYRPVLQAASRAFVGRPAFVPGPWDDMSTWFGLEISAKDTAGEVEREPGVFLQHSNLSSRASLRAETFKHRPGHADQLHVDIWWGSQNLALDPGTFQYNAAPPWDNPLTAATFHNTVTVDGQDQMTPAGRFLYVDRAQAIFLERSKQKQSAEHNGYRSLNVNHQRTLSSSDGGWEVVDILDGTTTREHRFRLHWLLPDFPWRLDGANLGLDTPQGWVDIFIKLPAGLPFTIGLARGGVSLIGPPANPAAGWYSPTYGVKIPALSFSIEIDRACPVHIETKWVFSGKK